jgi:hypothetical protein
MMHQVIISTGGRPMDGDYIIALQLMQRNYQGNQAHDDGDCVASCIGICSVDRIKPRVNEHVGMLGLIS